MQIQVTELRVIGASTVRDNTRTVTVEVLPRVGETIVDDAGKRHPVAAILYHPTFIELYVAPSIHIAELYLYCGDDCSQ